MTVLQFCSTVFQFPSMKPAMTFLRFTIIISTLLALSAHAESRQEQYVLNNFNFHEFIPDGNKLGAVVHHSMIDGEGRYWIAHESGFSLFDGHSLKHFSSLKEGGVGSGFVRTVAEGPDGTIWLGSFGGGLYRYDEHEQRAVKVHFPENTASKEFDGKVWTMEVGRNGNIWIGSFSSGLFVYNPASNEFKSIWKADSPSPRAQRIDGIQEGPDETIYFAAYEDGIFSIHENEFDNIHQEFSCSPAEESASRALAVSENGDIALGCSDRALIRRAGGKTIHRVDYHSTSESGDSFLSSHFLNDGSAVLFGTGSGTLHHVRLDTLETTLLPEGSGPSRIRPGSVIWDITESEDSVILVSTETGLYLSQPTDRQYAVLMNHGSEADHSLKDSRGVWISGSTFVANHENTVVVGELPSNAEFPTRILTTSYDIPGRVIDVANDALVTSDGQVIFSTEGGLYYSVSEKKTLTAFGDTEGKSVNFLREIRLDGVSYLYFGQINGGIGRIQLPLNNDSIAQYYPVQGVSIGFRHAYHIDDVLWLTGFNGIQRFSLPEEKFLPAFSPDSEISRNLQTPYASSIVKISDTELFIGTSNGLFRATLNSNGEIQKYASVLADTDMENMTIGAIARVNENYALAIGMSGFVYLNIHDDTFRTLHAEEGAIPGVRPTLGRYDYDPESGKVILSSYQGAAIFEPAKLDFSVPSKPLRITEITSFRDNDLIHWPVQTKELMQFTYMDRVIRFRFGMLDPFQPDNNGYSVRLEGFRDQWINTGELREFNFTNLDPGEYVFQVRAHDYVRPWSKPAEFRFEVLPPWWKTWWAYTLYAVIFLGSLLAYFTHLRRKLRREQDISAKLREADKLKTQFLSELEIKVDEATSDLRHAVEALEIKNVELEVAQQQAQDASRLKSEFLANMSHEIRTPMNGVLGFTQLLRKSSLDSDQAEYVDTIDSSAHNLLDIINDILDLSKIEAGKLIIDNTGFTLRTCATETIETLAPVAYDKNLELTLEISSDLPSGVRGDPVRMRQVITNLVGNAIKFTDQGTVSIAVRPARLDGKEALEISVTDTGRGISAEDRQKLFSAFERGRAGLTSNVAGTGLGLVITKKLTEAMGGEISLESEAGKGTRVSACFPLLEDRNPENRYEVAQPLLGKRVHLADANENSRAALHELLTYLGAEVSAASLLDGTQLEKADMVVLGISRSQAGKADDILGRTRERIDDDKPLLCMMSTTDRSEFSRLGEKFNALCLPKIGQLTAQTRRIEDWLRGGEPPPEAASGSVHVPGALNGLSAVIADDNRINRYFLRKMLESHGATVHEAVDGREALALLTADDIDPDIALIDLHMPEIDGLELAERARAKGVDIPLLVVSANVLQETRNAARAAGFDDYILKPVEEEALLDAVQRYTRR